MISRMRKMLFVFAALLTMFLNSANAAEKPLKIFILAGQSNMQGHAKASTLPGLAMDPETKPLYDKLVDETGKPRVHDHISIAYFSGSGKSEVEKPSSKQGKLTVGFGSEIGPELAFGVTMSEHLKEPILIIKTAWGGKSLNLNFRPPSAGTFDWPKQTVDTLKANGKYDGRISGARKVEGIYYRLIIEHVNEVLANLDKYHPGYNPRQGYEIAGFVWLQGFNDIIDDWVYPKKNYSLYSDLLAHFIRDMRKDLKAPKMPFVIGVYGVDGENPGSQSFRKAMAAPADLPEFKGNVFAVHMAKYWDEKLSALLTRKSKKETLTNEENDYIAKNQSNAAFHYLGSAKILSRIGQAFAEALIDNLVRHKQ